MNDQSTEQENAVVNETVPAENTTTEKKDVKRQLTKKNICILGGIVAALLVVILALVIFIPSKFERVKNECVEIAGMVTGSGDYFMIDTHPETGYVFSAQENALEAIQYANEAFGFNGSVYSQMMNTTALMGRQSVENEKYKVSWTYHPDDGLEVTYEKK